MTGEPYAASTKQEGIHWPWKARGKGDAAEAKKSLIRKKELVAQVAKEEKPRIESQQGCKVNRTLQQKAGEIIDWEEAMGRGCVESEHWGDT